MAADETLNATEAILCAFDGRIGTIEVLMASFFMSLGTSSHSRLIGHLSEARTSTPFLTKVNLGR
jgi:hypothetical protein